MRILTIREEDITLAKILKDSGHVYKGPTDSYTMDEVVDIVASIFFKVKNNEIKKKYDRLLGSKDIDYSDFNDPYHSQFRLDYNEEEAKRKYSIDFIKMFPTERFKKTCKEMLEYLNNSYTRWKNLYWYLSKNASTEPIIKYEVLEENEYRVETVLYLNKERFIVLGTDNDLSSQINQLLYDIREEEAKYKYYNSRSRTVVDKTRDVLARTIKIKQQNILALYQTYLCNELFNALENHIIESY